MGRVSQGFLVERSMSETRLLYDYLVDSGQFDTASTQVRFGQTKEQLTDLGINLDIAPLHLKINFYRFFRTACHLVNSREAFDNKEPICDGRPRTKLQNAAIAWSKKEMSINAKYGPLNMPMDAPKEGASNSPGCDTDKYFTMWSKAF